MIDWRQRIAEEDPMVPDSEDGSSYYCYWCRAPLLGDDFSPRWVEHAENCTHRLAVEAGKERTNE